MSKKRHAVEDEPHFLVRTLALCFSDGHEIEPHAHDWSQLLYAASGVVTVWTAQGSWVAPPHGAIWAPAGVAHAMRFAGAASLTTLYLRPGQWDSLPSTSAVIAVSPLLRELIQRAVAVGMLDGRERAHAAMADLIADEIEAQPAPALDLPLPQSAVLRRVADHVAAHPDERAGHAELAGRFGVGTRTLERGFAAETGLSLGKWRRQARLLHALRLLGAGAPVKRAAQAAGYRSASAFVAAFRASLGATPARYFEAGEG
ncbi:MAG: helix-turn-helix transcriptional regulator [Pseudomonadota bacterium]|nr:helix-turn-helix transcriptional regulator [Pseudomonadota bacterium]